MHKAGPLRERRALLSSPRHYAPAVALFAIGLLATATAYRFASQYEESESNMLFERAVGDAVILLEDVLGDQIHELEAGKALFESSQKVEPHEFSTFMNELLSRSDLAAVEWVPRVTQHERAGYEAALSHGEGITEHNESGAPVRARLREEYFPIEYVYPKNSTEAAVGFDLGSEPMRDEALRTARDTDKLAVAGPLTPINDTSLANSYLLVLPHYRSQASTVAERRSSLEGFVVGVLSMQTVLRHVLRTRNETGIVWTVDDGARPVAQEPAAANGGAANRLMQIVHPVQFGTRTLSVNAIATVRFSHKSASMLPLLALAGGGTLSLLSSVYLAWLLAVIARQRETQRALASERERYRTLVEEAPEAILLLDTGAMRFVEANAAAERLVNMSHDHILRLAPADVSAPVQPGGEAADRSIAHLVQRALKGEFLFFEWVVQDAYGQQRPCEVRVRRLPGENEAFLRLSIVDVSERYHAEQRLRVLLRELDHRVKNCFATVLALAEQTAGSTTSLAEFHTAFSGRVRAMARAHEALASRDWKGAGVQELVERVLGAYDVSKSGRIRTRGHPTVLAPQAASAVSMLLHELATNATKYGALSVFEGHVDLDWACEPDDGRIRFEWREHAGPTPAESRPSGFGTKLIHGLVEHELGGEIEIEHRRDGLRFRITLPPEHVAFSADDGAAASKIVLSTAGEQYDI